MKGHLITKKKPKYLTLLSYHQENHHNGINVVTRIIKSPSRMIDTSRDFRERWDHPCLMAPPILSYRAIFIHTSLIPNIGQVENPPNCR